jgi:hypothetical protein
MISKKKILYLGVGLVGAYFLFPHASQVVDYVKNKFKKRRSEPTTNENKKVCNCKQAPCNC